VPAEESSLEGGPLKNKYVLEQFHCHWGPEDSVGSEHLVDGKSYAAEVNMIETALNFKYAFANSFQNADSLRPLEHQIWWF
jgi:carbonic anhydrase